MTRQELVERIRKHETQCGFVSGAEFGIAEVVELADGVLAVRETDGEHTLYFDKSKVMVRDGAVADISSKIRDFPADTGFIEDVMSRNWQDMTRTARMGLAVAGGGSRHGKIKWYKKPVKIEY